MRQYKEELKYFIRDKLFMLCLALTSIAGYGFAVLTVTIGIDTLEGDRYLGSGNAMIRGGRFGQVFWGSVLGYRGRNPYASYTADLLAVLLLVAAAVHFCVLFRRIAGEAISKWAYLAFCCVMVSYPLANELWDYTGANCSTYGSMLAVAIILLLLWTQIHDRFRVTLTLPAVFLMMIVCASYESVVVVYVFFVFAILLLQCFYGTEKEKRLGSIVGQGLIYAAILAAGLVMRVVVHKLLLQILHLGVKRNGATQILWGRRPPAEVLKTVINEIVEKYLLKAIIYFPLTEVAVCLGLVALAGIVIAIKRRYVNFLLPGAGMVFSLVMLALIQGKVAPYRTCQVFMVFTAFSVMALLHIIQRARAGRRKVLTALAFSCTAFLCLQQASCLNYFLTLNYLRSEEEAEVIRDIAYDLQSEYDTEKPILFVGKYQLSDSITKAARISKNSLRWRAYTHAVMLWKGISYEKAFARSNKLPWSSVKSVLQWGIKAFGAQDCMANLFAYYGFRYTPASYKEKHKQAAQYVEEHQIPVYPEKGYIADTGDYLIVRLGE